MLHDFQATVRQAIGRYHLKDIADSQTYRKVEEMVLKYNPSLGEKENNTAELKLIRKTVIARLRYRRHTVRKHNGLLGEVEEEKEEEEEATVEETVEEGTTVRLIYNGKPVATGNIQVGNRRTINDKEHFVLLIRRKHPKSSVSRQTMTETLKPLRWKDVGSGSSVYWPIVDLATQTTKRFQPRPSKKTTTDILDMDDLGDIEDEGIEALASEIWAIEKLPEEMPLIPDLFVCNYGDFTSEESTQIGAKNCKTDFLKEGIWVDNGDYVGVYWSEGLFVWQVQKVLNGGKRLKIKYLTNPDERGNSQWVQPTDISITKDLYVLGLARVMHVEGENYCIDNWKALEQQFKRYEQEYC